MSPKGTPPKASGTDSRQTNALKGWSTREDMAKKAAQDDRPSPLEADAEHKEPLQIQILEKMSQLMTAAFGLVAALAWNDAMKRLIAHYFGATAPLKIMFLYALGITAVAVIASIWVANVTHKVKAALGHGHPPTTP